MIPRIECEMFYYDTVAGELIFVENVRLFKSSVVSTSEELLSFIKRQNVSSLVIDIKNTLFFDASAELLLYKVVTLFKTNSQSRVVIISEDSKAAQRTLIKSLLIVNPNIHVDFHIQ